VRVGDVQREVAGEVQLRDERDYRDLGGGLSSSLGAQLGGGAVRLAGSLPDLAGVAGVLRGDVEADGYGGRGAQSPHKHILMSLDTSRLLQSDVGVKVPQRSILRRG
jgi:hypothetical protein